LRVSDLIVSVDGQEVDDPNAFDYRFATKPLGGHAQLGVLRGGRDQTLSVALETAPELPRDELVLTTRSPFLGAKVWNLSPALSEELRIDPSSEGVIIADLIPGSPAQSYGFQRGDIVLQVNNQKITRTRDLERATSQQSRVWRVTIKRGGQQISVVLSG
jgi:S1-C subfamily serine protease